jgi:3-phosphoshikimate 1-carboxyvinyltransferase
LAAAALCQEPLFLRGTIAPGSADILLAALPALGVKLREEPGGLRLKRGEADLASAAGLSFDCGNCAESAVLLLGLCVGLRRPAQLRLPADAGIALALEQKERLLAQLAQAVEGFEAIGASVAIGEDQGGIITVQVEPAELRSGLRVELPALPQLNSALLLAAVASGIELTISDPKQAQDHCYRLLRALGAEMYQSSEGATVPAEQRLVGGELKLPGCPQQALARLLPALLLPGSSMQISQCSLNPRRAAMLKLLHESAPATREGAPGLFRPRTWQYGYEPVAALSSVYCDRIRGFTVLPNRALVLSGDLPWIILLASQAQSPVLLRGFDRALDQWSGAGSGLAGGTARLRYVAEVLRSFGIDAELESDGWRICGPSKLCAAEVQCAADPLISAVALLLARFADGVSTLYAPAPPADPLAWAAEPSAAEA